MSPWNVSHYFIQLYCNVPGGSIHDGNIFPFQKLSTLQLSTLSHSPNTSRASTFSDVQQKTPSTGPLLVISQTRTHILAVRMSPNTRAFLAISQY
jgi:hypothetical protein